MHEIDPQHALMFKQLVSQGRVSNGAKLFDVQPCATGMELDEETGEFLGDDCINQVFSMVQQDKLPGTALLGDFIALKFYDMTKNGEPWVKRLAFVLAAATAIIRQVCAHV